MNKMSGELENEEQYLVRALIDGSELAFCKLYAIYKERVINFSIRFVKSREVAEDIYHDTFAHIWITRDSLDISKKFSTYIFTIVKNKLIDSLRKQFQDRHFRDNILSDYDFVSNSTLDGVLTTDFYALYNKALDKLTPQQRKVFLMSREEYKSHKEIAEQLEVSIDTVKKHMTNTLSVVRGYLEKHLR